MELKKSDTIKEILERNTGKNAELILNSGKNYTCILQNAGQFSCHIEIVGSRSYYDAIIRIDDISAVEIQVRGLEE